MRDGTQIFQDVGVLGVAVDPGGDGDASLVLVDVYGSTSNVCGSVRFHLADPVQRRSAVALLRRWCRDDTPLTLIERGSSVALQDDHAIFATRFEPSPS